MVYEEPINQTGFIETMQYANRVTGELFGTGILIVLYVSTFLFLRNRGEHAAVAAIVAGYATVMLATFLLVVSVINSKQFFVAVALLTMSVIWRYVQKG